MAESMPEKDNGSLMSGVSTEPNLNLECAVCLQNCIHPAELPCGHVFCYLCIKGIVNQDRRCAMCRQDIPTDYLDKPRLLRPVENDGESVSFEDGHSWFYEGHNGWWQYDERTSLELETAYQTGCRCCELLVAGFLYVADFDSMLQYRRNDPCRRRRIKRDLATTIKKGVAGLKFNKDVGHVSAPNPANNMFSTTLPNTHITYRSLLDSGNESRTVENPRRRHRCLISSVPRSSEINEPLQSNVRIDNSSESEDPLFPGSSDMDSTLLIGDTLDWTIQQIESLQLDLVNDFENLSNDVDHYERLQNVLHLSRANSEGSQYRSQAPASRMNRSLENELDLTDRITRRSRLNRSEENVSGMGRSRRHWGENDHRRSPFGD